MTDQDTKKAAALRLLKRGLVTQSEAASLAGVSRQLMRHWSRDLPKEARDAHLQALWAKETRKKR
jgi:predicted DNA-binding protein (UPF0251 family)